MENIKGNRCNMKQWDNESIIPIVRVRLVEDYSLKIDKDKIYGIEESKEIFHRLIGASTVEKLALICMDNAYKPINISIVNIGTIDSINVSVGEIFRIALLCNAKYLIIAHNHPSNNMKPSEYDIKITKQIGQIAKMFNMNLLDSIIIGNGLLDTFSIRSSLKENTEY
ncbi:JAB domain-containing protein [Clostridium sp. ATCC 25772]|uniref:JAB domain-containing protein n=1 Tax=Clostridium sp. ATCC 25772 TaxID=1676991 RepID=UPI0007857B4C|nr:JAB domain-containing protein [Clostridium sp. ATCC 25772]